MSSCTIIKTIILYLQVFVMKRFFIWTSLILVLVLILTCGQSTEDTVKEDELDNTLWGIATVVNQYQLDLASDVASVAQGDASVDMESIIDEIWTLQQSLDELPSGSHERIMYIGATRAYVANTRVIYEKCSAFLADGNADDYKSFLHYFGMEKQLLANVCAKRTDYLLSIGFSQSEIENMEG